MRHKRWVILLLAFGLGITLFTISIVWAVVTGVVIPDQDPTAAMVAYANFHNRIVGVLMGTGVLLAVVAIVAASVLLALQLLAARRAA